MACRVTFADAAAEDGDRQGEDRPPQEGQRHNPFSMLNASARAQMEAELVTMDQLLHTPLAALLGGPSPPTTGAPPPPVALRARPRVYNAGPRREHASDSETDSDDSDSDSDAAPTRRGRQPATRPGPRPAAAVAAVAGAHPLPEGAGTGTVFFLPLFQRRYCWGPSHWETLWQDLTALLDAPAPDAAHSLGRVLLLSHPAAAHGCVCIDGQQRLTTLSLLLCSARDAARATPGGGAAALALARDIERGIFYDPEACARWLQRADPDAPAPNLGSFMRVVPTHFDRPAYVRLLTGRGPPLPAQCALAEAKRYFDAAVRARVAARAGADPVACLRGVARAALGRLTAVVFLLRGHCDPQAAFESFARKSEFGQRYYGLRCYRPGRPVSLSALIRNFVLGQLSEEEQLRVYSDVWCPLEAAIAGGGGHAGADTDDLLDRWFASFAEHHWPRPAEAEAEAEDEDEEQERLEVLGSAYPQFVAAFTHRLEAVLAAGAAGMTRNAGVRACVQELLRAATGGAQT